MTFFKTVYNPILTWTGYVRKRRRLSNLPSIAGIEVTNRCNLNCVICSRRYSSRPQGLMDMTLFAKIINEIKHSSRFTWLHLLGEPLLHPHIAEMIKLCKENGMKVGISTNATLLNEQRAKKILESGLDSCILAFDGVNKETYEQVRTGGVYETVEKNILNFLKLKKELKKEKPWTVIQTVEINLTESEIGAFKKKWKDSDVNEILVRKYSTSAGQIEDKDFVAKPQHQYIPKQKLSRPPCFLLWNSAVIFWNGDVSVCCHDCVNGKLVFGNLKDDDLKTIWNSPKIEFLRECHLSGDFPLICKDCLEYPQIYPTVGSFVWLVGDRLFKKFKFLSQRKRHFVTHAREQAYR